MSILRLFTHDPKSPLLFNSGTFFLCFTLFIAGYALVVSRARARVAYLLIFGAFYYYKCNGIFALTLVAITVIDYALARLLGRCEEPRWRKLIVVASVMANLGALGFFKYSGFFLQNLNWALGTHFEPLDLFLPIGISFHTFQSISYLVDVYRREIEPTDSLVDYAFFLSFFPQIVAGPIVRAGEFFPQIARTPEITRETIAFGVFRIVRGLVKKAVLADFIGVYCDLVFGQPASYGGPETLLAIYGYTLQIYFDFSGYSDMAVGMAAITGFHMPENFDAPYRATNITAFWQRWHMSLSKWLRDYLYIPLGGNRGSKIMRYRNLMLTMLLGGLWHGASWTFVLWGALHGAALSVHKAWGSKRMPAFIGWFLTIHFVAFTWVFFRATDFAAALSILAQLGEGWQHAVSVLSARSDIVIAVAIGAGLCVAAPRWSATLEQLFVRTPIYARAAALLVVIQVIAQLQFRDVQPFIYFQF